jgi:3-phosphoshikimate 1-carboxyvinyltransferase
VVGHTPLRSIDIATPIPSAQVKSAILLAGLRANDRTTIRESVPTRDHTERMLRARGVPVEREDGPGGRVAWTVQGGVAVQTVQERVPGDVSAAAFWLVAGAIHPDAVLTLRNVGVNPTRRAVIDILRAMGRTSRSRPGARPSPPGDRRRRRRTARRPRGPLDRPSWIELGPADVAAAIEIPVICLAATAAAGTTIIRGARELRHKESDRITGVANGLRAMGARISIDGDDLRIDGGTTLRGATTDSLDDHRLAMTFAVAGLIASGDTFVERPGSAAISYPGFFDDLERVRA